jgi:hypothetical protein
MIEDGNKSISCRGERFTLDLLKPHNDGRLTEPQGVVIKDNSTGL